MADRAIRVGIGGWTYPPWRGDFYPDGLARGRELEFAARSFGTIEINATFYGRQKPSSWEKWAGEVADGFKFSIKGSRYVVTRPRLADAGEGIGNFLGQGLVLLQERLGPILWILDSRRQFDPDDIAAFFALLPEELDGLRLRHVVEPRHDSFRDERFFRLCRERDVAVVFGDDDDFPLIDADTASFRYARLQKMRSGIPTGYDDNDLERFARLARKWSSKGRESYFYMINGAKERAPAAALALQQRLGIAPDRLMGHHPSHADKAAASSHHPVRARRSDGKGDPGGDRRGPGVRAGD